MNSFFKFLRERSRLLGIGGIIAFVLSLLIVPASSMEATSPRFNFLEGDYEMLRGANITESESVWRDPVTASAGDVVEGLIYYHNGNLDTVAENTKVQVDIPGETTNKSAHIGASISADNATTITSTVIDGQVIGSPGLTVNFDEDVDLSLVPGSVRWFPNRSNSPQALPGGQTGNEIAGSGINIGDIQGCWEFAGFVKFRIKSEAKEKPANLSINKVVKNISESHTSYVNQVDAKPGDKIGFKVDVTNTGESQAKDVVIKDVLPTGLDYLSSTLEVNTVYVGNESAFFANGITISSLDVGSKVTATFQAEAFDCGTSCVTLKNVAHASITGVSVSDDASVRVCPVEEPGEPKIVKKKSAYNMTQKADAENVPAKSNDVIKYTLVTENRGDATSSNFVVEDGIADILEYATVLKISDSGLLVDGPAGTNEAKTVQYPETNIDPGEEVVRTFEIKIKDPLPNNPKDGYSFDDKLYNKYGNEVLVHIYRPAPHIPEPKLSIDKKVRNVTRNELEFVDANTAFPGDMIEYKISFENTGTGPADRVKVYDVLPANVSLDAKSSAVISLGGSERSLAEEITSGYIIPSIEAGQSGYVRFKANLSEDIAAGEHLVNRGFIEDDGKTISDTADTVVKKKVVVVKEVKTVLPKTGPSGLVATVILGLFAAANVFLFRKKLAYLAATK